MHRGSQQASGGSVFYKPVEGVQEVKTGYLYKSPPTKLLMTEKSWKRRFFVLFKINQKDYEFKYFKSEGEREKPLGGIDLSQISLLYVSPQNHPKWGWVQKNFRCSSSCVLYLKAGERDYFLVGENNWEVDKWFTNLFDALKNRPHKILNRKELSNEHSGSFEAEDVKFNTALWKQRSMSDPPPSIRSDSFVDMRNDTDNPRRPSSEPLEPIYDIPRYPISYLRSTQPNEEEEENDDDYEYVNSNYMKMRSPVEEQTEGDTDSMKHLSDFSIGSSCSENRATSPLMISGHEVSTLDKRSSTESNENILPEERDINVNQADLKKHLTLTDVCGKPCVSGWTGQPQTTCLFHKGDQIWAINDLRCASIQDFNVYLSKLLKNQVKLTILRLPGCLPLHSVHCLCSD